MNRRKRVKRLRLMIVGIVGLLIVNVLVFGGIYISKKLRHDDRTILETLEITKDQSAKAKICIAGDTMMHGPMMRSTFYKNVANDTYNYEPLFTYIKPKYNSADYTICTFEGALGGGPYSGFPLFITPSAYMNNLQNVGIDRVLLASNHVYDGKDEGIHATMDYMDSIGLDYLGLRQSADIKPYVIQEINGIKVGMIDYVYEAGNSKTINWIPVTEPSKPLIMTFNYGKLPEFYEELRIQYQEMKAAGAEAVMLFLHWGTEYQLKESELQDQMAQQICDIGYNAIIGSHPHVIQPSDVLTSSDKSHQTFVAYAIGNHLSNQRYEFLSNEANGETEDGYMIYLTFERNRKGEVSISDIEYLYTWVYMRTVNGNNEYFILPLDDIGELANLTGITDLGSDPQDSIHRTDAILKESYDKVKASLPIKIPSTEVKE